MVMSQKFIHSLAAAVSVCIAFLFPLYYGISDTTSAAITIMVIAATDSLSTSVQKGFNRILGTIIGAFFGMSLIAMFPQERFTYLILLSLFVSFFLYIARAYRGDKTIFMLSAMTMMIVFDGGRVDDIFLYATQKVMMTIIGIGIYTFVSVYLFKLKNDTKSQKHIFDFVWFDIEDIKGTILTFLIFWSSIALWMILEIPYGFYIMVVATSLSLYTTYSIVKPKLLIILFSISFVFATISYIFILPNLNGWWELGLFLFIYSFLGFYLVPQQISIFFLLGISTFLIENEMSYDLSIFLFVLLIFYMFLFVLLFFEYFVFEQKAEYMFLKLKKRFLYLLEHKPNSRHLDETLKKLKVYANMIDYNYFKVNKDDILEFIKLCDDSLKTKDTKKLYNFNINFDNLKESKF
jgi:hypothetical protein